MAFYQQPSAKAIRLSAYSGHMKPATYRLMARYIFIVAVLCFCVSVSAQTVKVRGQVVDMAGAPVPNARVLLIDLTTLEIQSVSSDSKGSFEFNGLMRTPYEIKAASRGFVTGSAKIFEFGGDKVEVISPNPPPPLTVNIKITLKVRSTT